MVLSSFVKNFAIRLMAYKLVFASLIALVYCWFHLRLQSKVIPRMFIVVVDVSVVLLIVMIAVLEWVR